MLKLDCSQKNNIQKWLFINKNKIVLTKKFLLLSQNINIKFNIKC